MVSFSRSFSLANTVNAEAIQADYKNGVLTLSIPKREEAKPKQIKVRVEGRLRSVAAREVRAAKAHGGNSRRGVRMGLAAWQPHLYVKDR